MAKRVFVFLQDKMNLGGIEVLLMKIVAGLVGKRHKVVVTGATGTISDRVDRRAELFEHAGYIDLLKRFPAWLTERFSGADVCLISLHPWALMVSFLLKRRLVERSGPVRSFHLVTHSRAFFFDSKFPLIGTWLRKKMFFSAPVASTYFMNDAARDAHAEYWKCDLGEYPILRLLADDGGASWSARDGGSVRVVSVGRFVPFKGYNRETPALVKSLVDSGVDVSWDIWGYGPDELKIAESIHACGVSDRVAMRGALAYGDFHRVVAAADIFVGMGTALLEAAKIGVPSITAVENDSRNSYGYFYQSPSDSVGDRVEGAERLSIESVLRQFSVLDRGERTKIGELCRESAKRKSDTLERYIAAIEEAEIWEENRWILARMDELIFQSALLGKTWNSRRRARRQGALASAPRL